MGASFMEIGQLLGESRARDPGVLAGIAAAFLIEEGRAAGAPGGTRDRLTKAVAKIDLEAEERRQKHDTKKRRVYRIVRKDGAPPGEVTVGRGDDVDVAIELASVSTIHAKLACGADGWSIEDSGSRNGTFVNGDRLESGAVRPIASGTAIRLGPEALFTFLEPDGLAEYLKSLAGLIAAGEKPKKLELPSYLDEDDED